MEFYQLMTYQNDFDLNEKLAEREVFYILCQTSFCYECKIPTISATFIRNRK